MPTYPAHLIISVLDHSANTWKVVKETDLETDPRIWGEGLLQDMSAAEIDARFQRVLEHQAVPTVDLGAIETDLLKVECDREYPVWPSHGETNGNIFQVPYGIFNTLKVYGTPCTSELPQPEYMPILTHGRIQPKPPRGMTCRFLSTPSEHNALGLGCTWKSSGGTEPSFYTAAPL